MRAAFQYRSRSEWVSLMRNRRGLCFVNVFQLRRGAAVPVSSTIFFLIACLFQCATELAGAYRRQQLVRCEQPLSAILCQAICSVHRIERVIDLPPRSTDIPSLAQRCATATGWPRYFAILGQPMRTPSIKAGVSMAFCLRFGSIAVSFSKRRKITNGNALSGKCEQLILQFRLPCRQPQFAFRNLRSTDQPLAAFRSVLQRSK